MDLVEISKQLNQRVSALRFGKPVEYVYNPLQYAWKPHRQYLARYGQSHKRVILLGMNPGPWGMAQSGVPFGDIHMVRDWLGITEAVNKPKLEHPKRPIEGFDCKRTEVSGSRLWGWAKQRFGTPQSFFKDFFIANYCPLVFMELSGKNFTPDRLRKDESQKLFDACDRAVQQTIELLKPDIIIGVGKFAADKARKVAPPTLKVGQILHPSPASPAANRGWAEAAEKQLCQLGIELPRHAAPYAMKR